MRVGDNWNGWTVETLLGKGSLSKVYKIVRNDFGRKYESALKVISVPENSSELTSLKREGMSDDDIKGFYLNIVKDVVSEMELAIQLRGNSNIVNYEEYEVYELKDEFGWEIRIRMELLESLYSFINDHPFSEKDIIQLGIDICKALEVCKQFNIIHRDIKPDNIFISKGGI